MKTIKRKHILLFVLVLLVAFVGEILSPSYAIRTYADTDLKAAYEHQNVLTDLRNSTVGGEKFELSEYGYSRNGKPLLLSFVEFGYGYSEGKQDDYGLYVYIHNPQRLAIDTATTRNKIQLAFHEEKDYKPYTLEYLNSSTEKDYAELFYKFRVSLSDSEKSQALRRVDRFARKYHISGFTLSVGGTVTEYEVTQTYTYTGFAEGYGNPQAIDNALSCTVDGFNKFAKFDVTHTFYRMDGDYNAGKQSQLNSCYFSVPTKLYEDYGELTEIFCSWYEYVTKPILVTENQRAARYLSELNGSSIQNLDPKVSVLVAGYDNEVSGAFGQFLGYPTLEWTSNIEIASTRYVWVDNYLREIAARFPEEKKFDNFAGVFWTGTGVDIADFEVTGEEVEAVLLQYSESLLGGNDLTTGATYSPYYTDRFAKSLFVNYVSENHTRGYNEVHVTKDKIFELYSTTTNKSFWQRLFGGYDTEKTWTEVEAFHTITANDLNGADTTVADRLYVNKSDVSDIRLKFAAAQAKGETLVLFRFSENEYFCAHTGVAIKNASETDDWDLVKIATFLAVDNAYDSYLAQETVYLDFDIISMSWTADNGAVTEIPVVASPTSAISGITPPLGEDYHYSGGVAGVPWWVWLIVGGVVLVIMVAVVAYMKKKREG